MSSYGSSTDPRSPPFGTATFSTFSNSQSLFSPSRYSYTSSDAPIASSDSDSATSDRRMRRLNVSPTRSGHSYDSYSEENSFDERAEVEATLNDLDDELDTAEDMLTEWSRGSGPSSYTGTTPSYSTSLDTYSIYTREANRLSTISERTENIPSRPVSYMRDGARPANPTPEGLRLSAHRISTASPAHLHTRSVTDVTSDRPVGRRTGDLIAFFEDRATTPSDTSSMGHSRTSSLPGNRVRSPFFPPGQSTPYMTSTTGYGYTTTGYGTSTGYGSRPSSPEKSKAGSSISSASSSLSEASLLAPPTRGIATTATSATPLSPSDFASTFSNTFAAARSTTSSSNITPSVSSLRRPQTSPRSPLASVRNIVAAWKQRTPALGKPESSTESSVSPIMQPDRSLFGLRRRASRADRVQEPASENTNNGNNPPTTPKSMNSSIIPPPFDMTDLGAYARDSREPLRIGFLWYLNVHSGPPYSWQRCQALLYPHMLLLSWVAPGGGRGVVTLDLLNCTEVRSVPSPSHPSAKEDVGTIAARAQIAAGDCPPLMELLCPFQLLYSDGVERLSAESARERVRWVTAIWDALDRSVTLPSRSEPGSPTGSIRTIRTMTSTTSLSGTGSGTGSASAVFVPPLHTIPSLSDLSDSLSTRSLSRTPSFQTRARATDDAVVSRQSYLYPGDRRVIAPSRSSSLRRTSSLTDLDEEFASAVSRARNAKPGLGFGLSLVGGAILGDGSPVTVSSGPRLGGDVRVTPPPSSKTKSRPLSEVSDDHFFSAGSRTSSSEPRTTTNSFYTVSNSSSSSDLRPTTSGIITDETAFEFTSGGSNTQIVPSTLSYRRTESNSYLGDSHDGSYTYSSYTSTSPSRSTLSRSPGFRRRGYSRGYTYSDGLSDKENAMGYTASQSRSTLSTWTRSRSTTPTPAPSTAALSALEIPDTSGSEGYETANSPSTASFKSLPTIPSETDYHTIEQCKTEASTEFYTAERCVSDVSSEYVTAEKCKTETATDFYTAEKCKTETETEFITAELCECERTDKSETQFETASLCKTIPSEISSPRSLAIDLPVERAPTPPPKPPSEVPSLQSPESDVLPDIAPEPMPSPPPQPSPTISSASRDLESERLEVTEIPPSSIVSSGDLSISLPTTVESSSEDEESSRMPTISSSEPSEFVMNDIPISEPSLPAQSPLASTESTPSIHPSQWASETDISYDSSHLHPTPLTQVLNLQEGRDISLESSFTPPGVSPITSLGSLTAITDTILSSAPSTPLLPLPTPPPLPAPLVAESLSSPSSGPTPMTLSSTASSSLSRTPSTVSSVSSLSTRITIVEEEVMEEDEPTPSEVSTEPSLLSTRMSSVLPPYYPNPVAVPLPLSPAPVPPVSPAPTLSVSISTPQTHHPSIHSTLETEPTQTHTEQTEIITHEIDRLLEHIHEIDRFRGQETHEISDNVRIIRDELYDLSEYVRTHMVETERVVIAERPEAPPVPPLSRRDQSVGGSSVISSEPRAAPVGPRSQLGLVPILLSPPPSRALSVSSRSSAASFWSSHHSDDFTFLEESEEFQESEMPPPSPAWPSEPSPPSSDFSVSLVSSSETSPGPTLSLTSSSSSSPIPPPSSPTPSIVSTRSTESSVTARPVPMEGILMTTIRDMLTQVREQTTALWDGQTATNHMLDELRQSRPAPQDSTEIYGRLDRIERLIETLINTRLTTARDRVDTEITETTTRVAEDATRVITASRAHGSVTESDDSQADAESLFSRWEHIVRGRERGHIPIRMPAPRHAGLTLDDQLLELLNVPPPPIPSDIEHPPPLTPFVYQPAPRPSRSRSTSPVLRRDTAPPLLPPLFSPETLHSPLRPVRPPRRPLSHTRRPPPQMVDEPTPRVVPQPLPDHVRPTRPQTAFADPPPGPPPQPEPRPRVRPPGPFLPEGGLYGEPATVPPRVPTAPATLGGQDPRQGSGSWYSARRDAPVPPPPVIDGQPRQGGAQAQGPAYVPMPPGPTVVQLPLFDTLMEILREHRLAQLASVDQQRELMRYMGGLNEWLARDVQDRQAELRGVTARVDQLRADLNFIIGARQGIPMPQPQPQAHPSVVIPPLPQLGQPVQPPVIGVPMPTPSQQGQGVGGFIPPMPHPASGTENFVIPPLPPVIPPLPAGFVPQGGFYPPVIPGARSPSVGSPVIPGPHGEWDMPEPRGPPVIPSPRGFEDAQRSPDVYVHRIEDDDEPVIPVRSPTPSSGSESPLHVPGRNVTHIIAPSHSDDSRSSTPTQESYHPPASPTALPIPPTAYDDVPAVITVSHSDRSSPLTPPPPQQTIINLEPQTAPVPPPGQLVPSPSEPIIVRPGQPQYAGAPEQRDMPMQPGMQGMPAQPGTIIIQPSGQPMPMPLPGPSRATSRASTRPPVVVVPSSQEYSPRQEPPIVLHSPSIHTQRSPTIHAFPEPAPPSVPPVVLNIPTGGSRSYTPEGRRYRGGSRTPPGEYSPRDDPRRPRYYRRSRSYSPDDGYYRGRYYDDYPPRGYRRGYSPSGRRYRGYYDDPYYRPYDDRYYPDDGRRPRHPRDRRDDRDDRDPRDREGEFSPRRPDRRDDRDPRDREGEYSPRRPDRRDDRDLRDRESEYSPRRRGSRADRRLERSPEDPGRHRAQRRPSSVRSDYGPGAEERDAGDRPRLVPSDTRSARGPEYVEEHPSGAYTITHPASPAPPTIIRLGGDHPERPLGPTEQLEHELRHLPGDTYIPVIPSDAPEHRRRPSISSSAGGPQYTARGAAPPSMIMEDEQGEVVQVPPPTHPGTLDLEDTLRAQRERLDDAERELTHVVNNAHEAEATRDKEFRDNEDAREHIFLENEDRRDAEARQRSDALFQQLEERAASVPPIPVPPPTSREPETESIIESIHAAAQDAATRHASDILDTVRMEREEMARERELLAAEREREHARFDEERRLIDEERQAKIAALEEELARTRAELDNEHQMRLTEENEARMAAAERDEALRNQLADLTNMVQQNHALCEEKKALMDEHWAEKQRWKEERDGQIQELMGMVSRLVEDQAAARQREEEDRQANEGKPSIEQVMEELQRQNAEQRELLNALSENWRADSIRQHEDTINAVRATANEQVPYNVQGYLDEFSKALAIEVRMLLGEVGKLREERRNIQHELGYLMMMKSKYGPGGEFDPEWKPPMPPGPPPAAPPPPPEAPPPPEEIPQVRPAWRTVPQRSTRRIRKRQEPVAPQPEAIPEPRQVHSWVTWQPNPALAPTPPSVEPTLLVPDRGSPGLFGPRSPRDSYRS